MGTLGECGQQNSFDILKDAQIMGMEAGGELCRVKLYGLSVRL
jgi:hypothetical protein